MPTGPREVQIVNRILRELRKLPGCMALKIYGNMFIMRGTPDIIGCYRGRTFAFEAKRPGGKPTPIQKVQLERWAAAGAITAVVHSVEEVLAALEAEPK